MKTIKKFEDFINEGRVTKEEIAEYKNTLSAEITEHKIDKVEIDEIAYQYRYNGVTISGKCFSGKKEIDDTYSFFDTLAELLRPEIKKGGNPSSGSGDMSAGHLIALLPNIEIKMKDEIVKSDSWLDVEEGTDS
jgi:hypothetical protein